MFSRKELTILFIGMLGAGALVYFYTLQQGCAWGCTDFARAYSVSELIQDGRSPSIYHADIFLHQVMMHFKVDPKATTGWLYSPVYSLLIQPLAYLSYKTAFVASVAVQVILFYAAGYRFLWHKHYQGILAVSPTFLTALLWAQNGVLIAALYIAAFRFLKKKPALAGIILGTIIIKPQMGALIPVLLLVGGYYSACAAAIISASILCALSMYLYGVTSWMDYLHLITKLDLWNIAECFGMTSVYTMMYHIGIPSVLCRAAQMASALAAAAYLIYQRREWKSNVKTALLYTSILTLFVSPYLGIYDYVLAGTMVIYAFMVGDEKETFEFFAPIMLFTVAFIVFIQTFVWENFQQVIAPLIIAFAYLYILKDKRLRFI